MEPWLAYAPVKNNPEDAAKVRISSIYLFAVAHVILLGQISPLSLRILKLKFGIGVE